MARSRFELESCPISNSTDPPSVIESKTPSWTAGVVEEDFLAVLDPDEPKPTIADQSDDLAVQVALLTRPRPSRAGLLRPRGGDSECCLSRQRAIKAHRHFLQIGLSRS